MLTRQLSFCSLLGGSLSHGLPEENVTLKIVSLLRPYCTNRSDNAEPAPGSPSCPAPGAAAPGCSAGHGQGRCSVPGTGPQRLRPTPVQPDPAQRPQLPAFTDTGTWWQFRPPWPAPHGAAQNRPQNPEPWLPAGTPKPKGSRSALRARCRNKSVAACLPATEAGCYTNVFSSRGWQFSLSSRCCVGLQGPDRTLPGQNAAWALPGK